MYSPKEIVDNISSMIVVSTLMSLITIPIIVFIALKILFLMKAIILNLSAWAVCLLWILLQNIYLPNYLFFKLLGLDIFLPLFWTLPFMFFFLEKI